MLYTRVNIRHNADFRGSEELLVTYRFYLTSSGLLQISRITKGSVVSALYFNHFDSSCYR